MTFKNILDIQILKLKKKSPNMGIYRTVPFKHKCIDVWITCFGLDTEFGFLLISQT